MPAGAWTVIIVGKDGPGQGTDQHLPNISSIRTDSTAPKNLKILVSYQNTESFIMWHYGCPDESCNII